MLSPTRLVLIALSTTTLPLLILVLLQQRLGNVREVVFKYTGVSPVWNIGPLNAAMMDIQNTVNYQLNGTLADQQWAALIPERGGIVHLGPNKEPFMLSMFHQLRCLDIIRQAYVEGSMGDRGMDGIALHCVNYIRQMVLCRGDRRLERVVDPFGPHAVQVRDSYTCSDWNAVYAKVEENQKTQRDHQHRC